RAGHGEEEHDARAGEGREADERLRPSVQHAGRFHHWRRVHRSGLQESEEVNGRIWRFGGLVIWSSLVLSAAVSAQPPGRDLTGIDSANPQGRGRGPVAKTPKDAAPIDLTGYWVSIVSEDWRFRMLTPPKGDHPDFLLNDAGTKLADAW